MKYCLVENNKVTDGPRNLPKNWRNISGFYLATDEMIKENGWLPYTDELAVLDKYEVSKGTRKFTINEDGVLGVEQKRVMTDDEKTEHDQYLATQYQRSRKPEYPSIEDVTVALAEKAEGDSAMWNEITKKRQAIKKLYPKP